MVVANRAVILPERCSVQSRVQLSGDLYLDIAGAYQLHDYLHLALSVYDCVQELYDQPDLWVTTTYPKAT